MCHIIDNSSFTFSLQIILLYYPYRSLLPRARSNYVSSDLSCDCFTQYLRSCNLYANNLLPRARSNYVTSDLSCDCFTKQLRSCNVYANNSRDIKEQNLASLLLHERI
jgi:hypothetical protein